VAEVRVLFFAAREFRGTELEKAVGECGVPYAVAGGREIEMVVVFVLTDEERDCVLRALIDAVDHIYEMEGTPRVLRYISPVTGRVRAEVEFR
jgi:hypothetical protein